MTDAQWLACSDPRPLLAEVSGRISPRKVRLLICACCRRVWDLLLDERCRRAVEVAERYADGRADDATLEVARRGADATYQRGRGQGGPLAFRHCGAAHLALQATARRVRFDPRENEFLRGAKERKEKAERKARSDLVRDLLGNPFRPAAVDPAWQTPTVTALARAAYDERSLPEGTLDPHRLAVLADALEEAGCTDPEVLGHLRSPGPHFRGCWSLDLALGRA
jgi:hypothetical protein